MANEIEQPSMFGEEHRKVTRRHELKPGDTFCYGPARARFEVDPNGIDRRGHAYTKPLRDAAVYAVIRAAMAPEQVAAITPRPNIAERHDSLYAAEQLEQAVSDPAGDWGPAAKHLAARRWSRQVSALLAVREADTARAWRYEVTCQPNYVED